jgi:hypothetical protein
MQLCSVPAWLKASGDAMADNIVDIAFADVTIIENVSGTRFEASMSGTLQVNYTTGAITNCALTASGTGFPTTTFTSATLTANPHDQFEINATSGPTTPFSLLIHILNLTTFSFWI